MRRGARRAAKKGSSAREANPAKRARGEAVVKKSESQLNSMAVSELRALCESYGLAKSGKKPDLIERVQQYYASH